MPYYKERFINRSMPQTGLSVRADGSTLYDNSNLAVMDSVEMTSFRSRPHSKALGTSTIIEDIKMDPYAAFLRTTSERQYREALESRGLVAKGAPDRGHAFELKRHTVMTRPKVVVGSTASGARTVNTGVIPHFQPGTTHVSRNETFRGGVGLSVIPYQEDISDLRTFGQLAYNRVAPTSEVFNAATFFGELLEGLPRLVPEVIQESLRQAVSLRHNRRSGERIGGSVGSDYLNVQFGWLPLVSDIQNAATALGRATAMLAQNGERVHRKYSIPTETQTSLHQMSGVTLATGLGSSPGVFTNLELKQLGLGSNVGWSGNAPNGNGTIHKRRQRDRWFEGEFSSFYRLGFDPSSYLDRLDALVNTKITPEVLWELAPWSWLVDWQLHLGDSIRANQIASDDRLVMHYGYAMEQVSYRALHDMTHKDSFASGLTTSTGFGTSSLTAVQTTYKRRIRANPYGFRATAPSALSGGQLAILGALGLTKL